MKPIRRIIASIKDPAHGVTPAASKAAQLARALGAQLELFHAITTPIYLDNYTYSDWSLSEAKRDVMTRRTQQLEYLAHALQENVRVKPLSISVQASWDWPGYAAVIRRAQAWRADLVVADRHAGKHFARTLLHFADWELLRLCPAPLLLVSGKARYQRPTIVAAVDPGHQWGKTASLDASILETSARLQAALGGALHAVHAFESVPTSTFAMESVSPEIFQELVDRRRASATGQFQRLLRGRRIPKSRQHLFDAPPVTAVTKVAREQKADIVTLGAVSRSALKHLFIGSTAETLLDRLSCDLLIVKPSQFKGRVVRATAGARVIPAAPVMPAP